MPKVAAEKRIKPVFLQYGGKTGIAKWIVSRFPEHETYCEPFFGGGAVLFAKPITPFEFVNDRDQRLIRMWETLRARPEELAAALWATPYSRENWRSLRSVDEIEDARILVAQHKMVYGGSSTTSTFSNQLQWKNTQNKPKHMVWSDWFMRVLPAAARLKDVVLFNEDAVTCVRRFQDNPKALIYCDPPYLGHEHEYKYRVDYKRLAVALHESKARVIVSGYDKELEFFPTWRTEAREKTSRCGSGKHGTRGKTVTERLFFNWEG